MKPATISASLKMMCERRCALKIKRGHVRGRERVCVGDRERDWLRRLLTSCESRQLKQVLLLPSELGQKARAEIRGMMGTKELLRGVDSWRCRGPLSTRLEVPCECLLNKRKTYRKSNPISVHALICPEASILLCSPICALPGIYPPSSPLVCTTAFYY